MTSSAKVLLWGSTIGTVALEDGARAARFEYDRDFIGSGIQIAPLTMPLGNRVYSFPGLPFASFHGLPGLLADSLPDKFGNAVINRWLESQGRTNDMLDAVERLCYTGSRGMGALEYVPSTGPNASAAEHLHMNRLVELAEEVLTQREQLHTTADDGAMRQIISVGTSAGGARAKAIVAWNPETGDIRSGQVDAGDGYGYWIVKFDGLEHNADLESADRPGYTRREYAYYLMATTAGISMSECRLLQDGNLFHFMTKRFDRTEGVGGVGGKLHMQTLGGIAHFDYRDPESYSYEMAVQVMRRLQLGQDEVEQLFKRMVFNIMARNQDDHVKNVSFLMDKSGEWRLSPAYDMTYAYNPAGRWTRLHQMSCNGKHGDFTLEDLVEAARHMSMRASKAKSIIGDVQDAISEWRAFAEEARLSEWETDAIARTHILW